MKKRRNVSESEKSASPSVREAGGGSFEVNPFYENLVGMRERKPEAFKNLSPATRFALEAYLKARQAFTQPPISKRAA